MPGRAAIDLLASWVGNCNVGVVLTTKQYESGYYTDREAILIASCFSATSLPFCLVIAAIMGVDQYFIQLYFILSLVGTLMAQPFMAIYRDDYFIGWKFIPLLTMATAFASFDNFLNSIYMVEKRSTLSFTTMAVGAGINVALNFTLIPVWGVNGAALATFVSYFVVFLLRAVNTRGLIRVDFAPEKLCCNFGLLVLESALMMWQVKLWRLWCSSQPPISVICGARCSSCWAGAKRKGHK